MRKQVRFEAEEEMGAEPDMHADLAHLLAKGPPLSKIMLLLLLPGHTHPPQIPSTALP